MEPKTSSTPLLTGELRQRFAADADPALSRVRQLYRFLYTAITDGRLPAGSCLPPSRELAKQLGLGRNTVVAVYRQLSDESLVAGDGRRGTRVCYHRSPSGGTAGQPPGVRAAQLSQRALELLPASSPCLQLAPGEPDAGLFPAEAWRRACRVAARLPPAALGYRPAPVERLQAAIARYLATYRSLPVTPSQILITASTRQSLLLAATLYADPGDLAWIEAPGYGGAAEAFSQQGLALRACPVDAEGIRLPSLEPPAAAPRLIYVTPCFQYPTGVALSVHRRSVLLNLSARHGSVIFEDDYDSEFRDASQPRPALLSGQAPASVLHAGTFSKLVFPAVRVAWLVVPESQIPAAQRCLRAIGGGHNTVAQTAVAELLDNGTIARHLQRARQVYAQRRETLLAALARQGGLAPAHHPAGSLSLVVTLPQATALEPLQHSLLEHRLGAVPLECFYRQAPVPACCRQLVLGLGNIETLAIDGVVTRLYAAIRQAAAAS